MSNVSNIHAVVPFVAGKSQALSGQRLAKIGYKTTAKTPAKFPSVCVSVPMIAQDTVIETWERIGKHCMEFLAGKQDDLIRSLYENGNGKITSVSDEDISVEALIAYLDAESNGGRMNKEMIERWFVDSLETNLATRIAELKSIEDEAEIEKTVMPIVRGYRGMFAAMATGVTVYPEDKCKNLLRALELAGNDSPIGTSLKNRLETMLKPKEAKMVEMLDNL